MDRPSRPLRLGTRGSRLALAQAHLVARALSNRHGWDLSAVEIVEITTTGDRVQDRPLAELGGKALWTKELDRALLAGEVDACVHSMKDVESERPESLCIAAMLEREDVRDRLIGAMSIEALPDGAVIGTSSPRRAAQLRRLRPDVHTMPIRGNVETRLRKVAEGEFAATLLAAAGLERLRLDEGATIETDTLLPAPGQAAIGIECRRDDGSIRDWVSAIRDDDTFDCVAAERAFTRALGGSCASPVAALGRIIGDRISLRAQILSADGADAVEDVVDIPRADEDGPAALATAMLERASLAIRRLFDGS